MEHLLFWSKCSIFHNIFKYVIFQRCQKVLLSSKRLNHVNVRPGIEIINFFMLNSIEHELSTADKKLKYWEIKIFIAFKLSAVLIQLMLTFKHF